MPHMADTRWVTFDCFGTLVDWRQGIRTSAELVAPGRGDALLDAYHRIEAEVEEQTPLPRYRQVLAETFRRACAAEGVDVVDDDLAVLGATIPFWPVFPEVSAELAAVREAGWHLALLTNCDRDIIGETQRRLQVPIDAIVTAEDSGAYKPAHNHFLRFEQAHEVARDRWVHVAQSYFHDMLPARELGLKRVWINRLGEGDDPSVPHAVQPDLVGLLATVEQVAALP
jgi:2-haloacid dehalogenase